MSQDAVKRPIGRPKGYSPCGSVKSEKVRVYLDEAEVEKLRRLCERSGEAKSAVMRDALAMLYRRSGLQK